jgi:acyl carrier protein
MKDEIAKTTRAFIEDELLRGRDVGSVGLDENLFTTGFIDSMGIMRLVAHLEKMYETKIPPTDLTPVNFMTIEKIADYVSARL